MRIAAAVVHLAHMMIMIMIMTVIMTMVLTVVAVDANVVAVVVVDMMMVRVVLMAVVCVMIGGCLLRLQIAVCGCACAVGVELAASLRVCHISNAADVGQKDVRQSSVFVRHLMNVVSGRHLHGNRYWWRHSLRDHLNNCRPIHDCVFSLEQLERNAFLRGDVQVNIVRRPRRHCFLRLLLTLNEFVVFVVVVVDVLVVVVVVVICDDCCCCCRVNTGLVSNNLSLVRDCTSSLRFRLLPRLADDWALYLLLLEH